MDYYLSLTLKWSSESEKFETFNIKNIDVMIIEIPFQFFTFLDMVQNGDLGMVELEVLSRALSFLQTNSSAELMVILLNIDFALRTE